MLARPRSLALAPLRPVALAIAASLACKGNTAPAPAAATAPTGGSGTTCSDNNGNFSDEMTYVIEE